MGLLAGYLGGFPAGGPACKGLWAKETWGPRSRGTDGAWGGRRRACSNVATRPGLRGDAGPATSRHDEIAPVSFRVGRRAGWVGCAGRSPRLGGAARGRGSPRSRPRADRERTRGLAGPREGDAGGVGREPRGATPRGRRRTPGDGGTRVPRRLRPRADCGGGGVPARRVHLRCAGAEPDDAFGGEPRGVPHGARAGLSAGDRPRAVCRGTRVLEGLPAVALRVAGRLPRQLGAAQRAGLDGDFGSAGDRRELRPAGDAPSVAGGRPGGAAAVGSAVADRAVPGAGGRSQRDRARGGGGRERGRGPFPRGRWCQAGGRGRPAPRRGARRPACHRRKRRRPRPSPSCVRSGPRGARVAGVQGSTEGPVSGASGAKTKRRPRT